MVKGKYRIVKGDVLKAVEGPTIISHICNDVGAWGRGFTHALDEKWPEVGGAFRSFGTLPLGTTQTTCVSATDSIYVVGMIAQHGLPSWDNPKPIKYAALVECMLKVYDIALEFKITRICCPKFGAGFARGNWDFIEELIKEIWVDTGLDVTVYELET